MNDTRRKELQKALDKIADAKQIIEGVKQDEEQSYDMLPESFQNGERGEKMQSNIDGLDEAITSLDEAELKITEAKE
jgi:prefoldin subunit 5